MTGDVVRSLPNKTRYIRGHWLFGCMSEMQRDPLGLYERSRREVGDHALLRVIPGYYVHLLTHPNAVEHVLQKNHKNYRKPDFFNGPVRQFAGDGVLTSEGAFWLRQRRMMQPAFHRQHLAKLAPLMVVAAEDFVREHQAHVGKEFDILEAMMKLTLRVAGETLFGADVSHEADEMGRAFRIGFEVTSRRMNTLPIIPSWFPTPTNRKFARAKKLIDGVVLQLIASRRETPGAHEDLLSLLLAAQDEEGGGGMTDEQIKNEVLTLLIAGHDTIGATLAWTWYLLGSNPKVQEELADEVRGRLQGRGPTLDDLPHLPLLRAVFDETLRLYPPAWGQPRETIGADEIDGVAIPAKTIVTVCQYLTHRHPEFWDEPERFSPQRFLGHVDRHKFAYFPFGGGPHICIGNQFALMEGPLLLATMVQHYRVQLVPGHPVVLDPTFTLRPKHGVKVVMQRR